MRRRDFIFILVGTPVGCSRATHAQPPAMPVVGYLCSISEDASASSLAAFREGLADSGFIEHQNVAFLYRYADAQYERLPALAAELVAQQVNVIVAFPSSPAALAAKRATSTIPIVFSLGLDPVGLGLVASYNRPGANVTGINSAPERLIGKRLEIIDSLVPKSLPIAELVNPANKATEAEERAASEAARTLGRELLFVGASTQAQIAPAFEEIAHKRVGGLIVQTEALFGEQSVQIVSLANRYHIVTVYPYRFFSDVGGFLSYGPNYSVLDRQVGGYVGQILKGARAADLPVMTPTTFDLVINLKTAKALGLTIPPTLLVRADEVIE